MIIKIPKSYVYIILLLVLASAALGAYDGYRKSTLQNTTTSKTTTLPSQQVREINVTAKQFEFTPNPIKVKLGEFVRLNMTSLDVTHGLSIPDYGINEIINPGEVTSVEFQAVQKGTFPFSCSVQCGLGHSGMRGALIVE